MSEPNQKPAVKTESSATAKIELEQAHSKGALVARYLKRKAEVSDADHREFQKYLQQKAQQILHADASAPAKPSVVNRRNILKVVAGTAIAGEAAAVGYSWVNAGPASNAPAGGFHVGPQREPISRQLTDSKADVGGRSLGRWILLLPTKLGGGTYAIDLHSNRVLASIWYWNYGDYNPISHHLCAFPSADPYRSFEFVNSTQGGKNCLIYGIPTRMETHAPGFHRSRVRYVCAHVELLEHVSETTGLGLGVHVTINPKDAQSYFVTDGQKDIAACFDRNSSVVRAALKYDWVSNSTNLADCWQKGGTLKISKIYPDPKTGKFDYEGTKGQKIEWEVMPIEE